MFRLNETYQNNDGESVRIICVDADAQYNGKYCPLVGLVTRRGTNHAGAAFLYSADGKYYGINAIEYAKHSLVSDEPNEEEAALINSIIGVVSEEPPSGWMVFGDRDGTTESKLLKIIRQLRRK